MVCYAVTNLLNVLFNFFQDQAILLHLLIDDGFPSRGHRKTLINPAFLRVGVGVAAHKQHSIVVVIDVAVLVTEEKVPFTTNLS